MSNSFIMTESIVRPAKMPYGRLKDNGFVGIEGEHAARALVVETKDDLSAFASINLIIDDLDCGAMTKTTSGGTTTLSKVLTSSMIGRSGRKICQLIMVNSDNTVVQKSSQFEAYVGRANEINRSVDDGVTIIVLSEAVTEMAREAAAAAAEEAAAGIVDECQEIADAASASADAAAQSASDAQTAAASIVVDATLDPTSTHAIQNKAVASEISSIKADLGAQTGLYHWNERGLIDLSGSSVNLTPETNQGIDYAVIDCSAGDKFIITGTGGNKSRVWGFIDSNNAILTVSDANATVENFEITAPTNAVKLILNAYRNSDKYAYKVGNNLASKIDSADGLSTDAKIALLNCFDNVAWDNKNGRNYYNILKEVLNLGLTSISAVFNQGNSVITPTDSIDDLRAMLTVTGSDGREIKAYTLSGSLNNAISTITVEVDELTTTFSVNVSSLPSGYTKKSYVLADGSQRIPSGIYEPDMVGAWIRQKQCTTELLDKAGHILSSTNYVVPFQRYFPTSNLGRVSYNRFGEQTTTYSKPGNYWNVNEDVIIESFKDGDKIFLNGEHIASLPSGSTMSSSNQLYFFRPGTNTNTVYAFRGRLYYMKLFNASGIKLHDFVPCKNSSNVAGLYDLVTGEFHAPDIGTLLTD